MTKIAAGLIGLVVLRIAARALAVLSFSRQKKYALRELSRLKPRFFREFGQIARQNEDYASAQSQGSASGFIVLNAQVNNEEERKRLHKQAVIRCQALGVSRFRMWLV